MAPHTSELGFEVTAIWSELIVLDTAKALTNDYGASVHKTYLKPNHSVREDRPERRSRHGNLDPASIGPR